MPKKGLMIEYSREELKSYLLHERGHLDLIGRLMTAVYAALMAFAALFIYFIIFFIDRGDSFLALKMAIYILIFLVLGWMLNGIREYYADNYSWKHCGKKPLISALRKIDKYKRRNLWGSLLRNYTHPPLESRIKLIEMSR